MNGKLLLFVVLGTVGVAHAEDVYKWTDAGGVVHYSDAPPPQDTANVQRVRVSGGAGRGMGQEGQSPTNASDPSKDAEKPPPQQASTVPDNSENRVKLCNQARANLELLQSKYQVSFDKENSGKPQLLDEKARQAQIADAQDQIAVFCKSS